MLRRIGLPFFGIVDEYPLSRVAGNVKKHCEHFSFGSERRYLRQQESLRSVVIFVFVNQLDAGDVDYRMKSTLRAGSCISGELFPTISRTRNGPQSRRESFTEPAPGSFKSVVDSETWSPALMAKVSIACLTLLCVFVMCLSGSK